MKNKEQMLQRLEALINEGQYVLNDPLLVDVVGSEAHLRMQTWLGRAVLVINVALPAAHPFRRQAAYYLAGGGVLGVQGMMSLLVGLAEEMRAGTFD